MKLGVNVDHTATLRESRGTNYPDPVVAAMLAEYAGCDSVVVHLREDRRHIKERDVFLLKESVGLPLNLEMSTNRDIVDFALMVKPNQATLVPERRREVTTEGGLDVVKNYKKIERVVKKLKSSQIRVSLFIDPLIKQIKAAGKIGADSVEINTGSFAEAKTSAKKKREVEKIKKAVSFAVKKGFFVAAGHGLDFENVLPIARIKGIEELNIGHSIICRSVFVGIVSAVEEMVSLIKR
ncbi:MAG: pyridoxine 5'-phosphate synthase [Candidatus Omnitrophica bacterium]|nr:pyridoxine 5'-phosphate synthase [Candidatus Omnitrophota bacterium]MBD3268684.1 pyridoxine 5'-phosphate synthase [Candidatus Omnitrophota bacterium]